MRASGKRARSERSEAPSARATAPSRTTSGGEGAAGSRIAAGSAHTKQRDGQARKKARPAVTRADEEIESIHEDSDDETAGRDADAYDAVAGVSDDIEETADEARLRAAKELLGRMQAQEAAARRRRAGSDADDDDDDDAATSAVRDAVATRLADDAASVVGRVFRPLAAQLSGQAITSVAFKRGHDLSVTCVAVNSDGSVAFTGSKDCSIIRWSSDPSKLEDGGGGEALIVTRQRYPGRRRTAADKAAQERMAAAERKSGLKGARAVVGSGYGGGRIGSTTDAQGALAQLSTSRIVHTEGGGSSIIIPAAALTHGNARRRAAGTPGTAAEAAQDALAKLRSVADYRIAGHFAEVLSIALSHDGQLLASGGRDKFVRVWRASSAQPDNIENFVGHKDAVTALSFHAGTSTHVLYSASADRSIKQWGLDEMAYIDTLFGHQACINSLCALPRERCVSVGDDRTARYWKIPEQSQLVFRGHASDVTIDAVIAINEAWFVSGASDGSLSLWHNTRKKPVFTLPNAHGDGRTLTAAAPARETDVSDTAAIADEVGMTHDGLESSRSYCCGITSLAHVPNSDLIISGSGDGLLRLWRVAGDDSSPDAAVFARGGAAAGALAVRAQAFKTLSPVTCLRMKGIINGIAISGDGRTIVAAVAQEPRLGAWWRYTRAHNGVLYVRLPELQAAEPRETAAKAR